MRLIELDPQWLFDEVTGVRVGFLFRSPTNREQWQSCFEDPPVTWRQMEMFEAALGDAIVQPCNPNAHWKIVGDDFATLSVTPSLDGSAGALWHGFITGGEIVGGLSLVQTRGSE